MAKFTDIINAIAGGAAAAANAGDKAQSPQVFADAFWKRPEVYDFLYDQARRSEKSHQSYQGGYRDPNTGHFMFDANPDDWSMMDRLRARGLISDDDMSFMSSVYGYEDPNIFFGNTSGYDNAGQKRNLGYQWGSVSDKGGDAYNSETALPEYQRPHPYYTIDFDAPGGQKYIRQFYDPFGGQINDLPVPKNHTGK